MAEHRKPLTPIQRYWLEGEQPWENDVVRWTALEQKMAALSKQVTAQGQTGARQREDRDDKPIETTGLWEREPEGKP